MNHYVVYDGRAILDPDEAYMLEYIGEATKTKAIEIFKKEWSDYNSCLFEYDSEGQDLTNGRMISFQG
jgi:hypothetical protein